MASLKSSRVKRKGNGVIPGGKSKGMVNLASKAMTVKKSVAGQSLQTDADNFVTNSEYPFVKPGDRVDGLKKFQSGGNKGLTIDNDYDLKTKSTNKAPYSRPPSKFAGDYKVFQALEKTTVKPPMRASGASMREMDPPAKIKEIKAFIKKNMNKMSDSKLSQAIRKKSDNKTEYNWNNKSGKVEAHTKKKTK